ncbi:MAG TPA: hypothetical protein VJB87_01165 [Candidatus Nanoarchaeia archaeon]|nr:hypothetical protein [Candidatus Nanoarchaeia archaeon]
MRTILEHEEKINFKENISIYWQLLKGQRRWFFLVLLIVFIIAALELTSKFLLKIIVDQGTGYLN